MKENRARRRWMALLAPIVVIAAAVTCHNNDNNITGLNPTPTPVPGARTATPGPGGNPTATPAVNPTATPAPGSQNATVNVGQGGGFVFMDQQSGNSTTTIRAGGTVNWVWVSSIPHSTTSGTCPAGGGECTPDGNWDSGIQSTGSFQHTFSSPGTFPYFCRVHEGMMTGTVVVQ
jgi:plastocyanin